MMTNKFLKPTQPVILVAWVLSFALAATSWAAKPDTSVPAKPEENDAEGHPTDYKNPIRDGNAGGVPHYHVTICEGTTLGWNPWGSGHRNSEPQSDQSKNRDTTPSAKSGKSHAAASSAGGTDGQVAIEGRTEGSTECTITLKEDDGTVRTLVVLVHVVKCTNANKGHRGITESPISLPTGNTLGNLIHDGKVRFDSVGTGETIGHIADFHIENLTDEPINCVVPPMILESSSVSKTLSIFAPGIPNTYSTPWASRLFTSNSAPDCGVGFVAGVVIFSLPLLVREPRSDLGASWPSRNQRSLGARCGNRLLAESVNADLSRGTAGGGLRGCGLPK